VKQSIFTHVAYNIQLLTLFITNMGQKILPNLTHMLLMLIVDALSKKTSAKYAELLGKLEEITSDYLKMVVIMKKEEKFHVMKFFFKPMLNGTMLLNPQVLFDASGTKKYGFDNNMINCVFRADITPSSEDMIEEEERGGWRVGVNAPTNSYTIYVSLESLITLWSYIYTGTIDKVIYRKFYC